MAFNKTLKARQQATGKFKLRKDRRNQKTYREVSEERTAQIARKQETIRKQQSESAKASVQTIHSPHVIKGAYIKDKTSGRKVPSRNLRRQRAEYHLILKGHKAKTLNRKTR